MIARAVAMLCVPLAAAAAAAQVRDGPDDLYYVRNDTGRSLTCGLRREPRRVIDRFVLVRGTDMVRPARGGERRTLICDSQPKHLQRFVMRPGIRYRLVRNEGVVGIRQIERAE